MFMEEAEKEKKFKWDEFHSRKRKRPCEYLEHHEKSMPNAQLLLLPHTAASVSEDTSGIIAKNQEPECAVVPLHTSTQTLSRYISMPRISIAFSPAMLIGIVHVVLNVFMLLAMLYCLFYFLYFVTLDIRYKLVTRRQEARAAMKEAAWLYKINRCDPTTRVPALESKCNEWDSMTRNGLSSIKYARIALEVLAETLDGFMVSFSWKSITLLLAFMVFYLVFKRR